jgi:thiol-disulfide isomerase/thioredoxin
VPCQREVPAVAALQREFNDQGLAVIGIDLDDDIDVLEAFRIKYGASYPLAVEDENRMRKAFGIRGCPATAIIDRKGRMVGRIMGGDVDWTSDAARALAKSLLGIGPPAPAPPAARSKPARRSVHLITAVAPDDPKLNEILDEAAASLQAGDSVEILFDAQSVGALRMKAQKAALEEAPFTAAERRRAALRFRIPRSAAPRNQFEYIQQLSKAGAKVLVNANAIHAFGLSDEEIHPIARRIEVTEMEKIVDESDACLNYSHE